MNKYYETITSTRGDALPNHRVQVIDSLGAAVSIFADRSGTRFTDAAGNPVDYATTGETGRAEFYWEADTEQTLQVLDAAGNLVSSIVDFADNFVVASLTGDLPQSRVTDLVGDLAAKAETTALAATTGAGLIGTAFGTLDDLLSGAAFTTLEAYGGGTNKTGAQNAAALLAILTEADDANKDVAIRFGLGTYKLAPVVAPSTTRTIALIGAAQEGTIFEPSVYDSGTRQWMFEGGSQVCTYFVENITIMSPGGVSHSFHGFKFKLSNLSVFRNLHANFVDGTAWQFERAHNSQLDVKTYQCGNSTDQVYACNITGNATAVFNDMLLHGSTERDNWGWNIENGTLIRSGSEMKVHGSTTTARALRLFNVSRSSLDLLCSYYWSGEMIVIADGANGSGEAAVVTCSDPNWVELSIGITQMPNLTYAGTGAGAMVTIDCKDGGSSTAWRGVQRALKYDTAFGATGVYHFRLKQGAANVKHDFTQIIARTDITAGTVGGVTTVKITDGLFDEQRIGTQSKHKRYPAVVRAGTPLETSALRGATLDNVGDIVALDLPGLTNAAPFQGMGILVNTSQYGALFGTHIMRGSVAGAISATTTLLMSDTVPVSSDGTNQLYGRVRRVKLRAKAMPTTWDNANKWELGIFKNGVEVNSSYRLKINTTTLNTTNNDRFPKIAGGDGTYGYVCDWFNQGTLSTVDQTVASVGDLFSFRLIKTGAPADMQDAFLEVAWEIVK